MASMKSLATAILVVLLLAALSREGRSQNCSAAIGELMTCGPYVLPGNNGAPSEQCCSALRAVNHGCLCETINIISSLPDHCSLPAVNCAA
uniref:Protein LIM1 n=1 Tax=Lilium longiflorum TaxID=4690 RepID=LIM1_LILLO|nr:RecName: Full=Protein LIM1; Flags: Precursor [Lilium longiflorum]BAA04831.1 ORF [Lilium longiflorum]